MKKVVYPKGTILYAPKRLPIELGFNDAFIEFFNNHLRGKRVYLKEDYYGEGNMYLDECYIPISEYHVQIFKKQPLDKKIQKILKI